MLIIPIKERIFEIIDGTMFVFEKGLEESDISTNYYRKLKSEGNKRVQFMDHPCDRRYNLVAFETISDEHKNKIEARYGNPYDYVTREPIKKMVKRDDAAWKFFLTYSFNGEKKLPLNRVKQYTRVACWLNMLKEVEEKRNKPIKDLKITVPVFFDHVKALMQIEKDNGASDTYKDDYQLPGDFPTTYQNLRKKTDKYIQEGYTSIIDKMYGNQLAAKINDEHTEAQLLSLIEDPRQLDDVLVAFFYNIWAGENGYKAINPRTVCEWRLKREQQISISRYGNSAFNEKFIREVKGLAPQTPLALVEHDDNNLDFLYTDESGYNFNKYVAICVIDSCTKLLLGKSYTVGQNPDQWQVYHAYLDAMYYLRSITGGWYLPFEIKADRWASKSLTPLYNKIGKFIPASHGNKHRGYIEPFFGSPLWKRSQQLVSQGNWSANNMTAKNRGVNQDYIKLHENNRPMIGEQAEQQIENFFHLLRHMPDIKRTDMNAPSKEQQFMEKWNSLHADDKRPINDEQFLLTFGITHNPERPITITNRGIEPTIKTNSLSYDMPTAWMYEKLVGAKVNVIYDPYDLSRVLITNHDDIRFIATTAQFSPRALKDTYTNSRTFLNSLLAEKSEIVKSVIAKSEKRKSKASLGFVSGEAMLQGGVIVKEMKNAAEQRLLEGSTGGYAEPADDDDVFASL